MRINEAWHKKHRMPKNPTAGQRVKWHKAHLKYCGCRKDIPASLKKAMLML